MLAGAPHRKWLRRHAEAARLLHSDCIDRSIGGYAEVLCEEFNGWAAMETFLELDANQVKKLTALAGAQRAAMDANRRRFAEHSDALHAERFKANPDAATIDELYLQMKMAESERAGLKEHEVEQNSGVLTERQRSELTKWRQSRAEMPIFLNAAEMWLLPPTCDSTATYRSTACPM